MFKRPGVLWMGEGTMEVPVEVFNLNRKRLVERLRVKKCPAKSVVFLQGGTNVPYNDTDVDFVFRQESYFTWTFGVLEPDCYGAVEVDTGKSYLFIPRHPESYAIWMGSLKTPKDYSIKYSIDEIHYSDEMFSVLNNLQPATLLVMDGINSDSGSNFKSPHFQGIEKFNLNKDILYNPIADLRAIKTPLEIEIIRYVVEISSAAHRKVMRTMKPGRKEYQGESEFLHYCYSIGGCRHVSYTCICGSGVNGAILHYGHATAPNDKSVQDGELCLFDMGANYFGYAADITCTFPANGKFAPDQKLIYEAVLEANKAVMVAAKPGVSWLDMHLLANRVLLTELKKGGLLIGDIDEMVDSGLGYIFQPHGLGHLLGLDVHDVGGYLPQYPARSKHPVGTDKLRMARILEEGMVITIEPGCYFIDALLDRALEDIRLSKFLIPHVIERFRGFGGVRIEDDVVITSTGTLNLTRVPRSVQEIEDWIACKDDDKY